MKIKKIAYTAAQAIIGFPIGFAIGFTLPFIASALELYEQEQNKGKEQ